MRNSIFYRRKTIMQKTTAKVKHRDYVPHGWIAFKFCNVHFYGFRAEEMEEKWRHIEYERYYEYAPLYEQNKTQIQNLRSQIDVINAQEKSLIDSIPFYRLWYTEAEKEKISEFNKLLDELSKQADELEKENKEIRDKSFLSVYECHRKIEDLLQQHGFVLTSTSSKGNECVTETEVWTLEE